MTSLIHDIIELELPGILKGMVAWGIVIILFAHFFGAPIAQWAKENDHTGQQVIVTPIPHPIASIANNSQQSAKTISSNAYESLSTDMPTLKPNKYGWPVTFERQKQMDPAGAYFATLNFGYGDFPGVYINVDQWKKGGGHVVVGEMPGQVEHYTVFTYRGTSTQVYYDRVSNQVYSMVPDPWILS